MQIPVDLGGRFLGCILGFSLIAQQREQQKVDRSLSGADKFMELLLFAPGIRRRHCASNSGFEAVMVLGRKQGRDRA
jgi:hypothetical protein